MAKPRKCHACGQTGHRRDHCPNSAGAAGTPAPRAPINARELVSVLVAAAESLGETKALAAVEAATGEVLRRSQIMRLALIKSRGANAKLRALLEDQREAKSLAKLDFEEKGTE